MDRSIPSISSYISQKIPIWNRKSFAVRLNGPKNCWVMWGPSTFPVRRKVSSFGAERPSYMSLATTKCRALSESTGLLKATALSCPPPPLKHRYCYADNNNGTCPKKNACPHPQVCQICAGIHYPPPPTPNQKARLLPKKNIVLAHYLEEYGQTLSNWLLEGFKFGFKIPNQRPRQFRLSSNLSSIKGKESILMQRIQQELQCSRIAGPFIEPPFPNIQVPPKLSPKEITRGVLFNKPLVLF